MEISEIIPEHGEMQRIYCPNCGQHCELTYIDFDEIVSGINIHVKGLPTLRCYSCGDEHLPDLSRYTIVTLHDQAIKDSSARVNKQRRKRSDEFDFTKVDFLYDPDDYFFIPGLYRQHDKGFLQPVFFKRDVLLKFDNSPNYGVEFASTTYGTIYTESISISFGINRNDKVVMWLGDIAKLPVEEQYYLRSENVTSDHSIGSEFYDGQIEAKFTAATLENNLFSLRSQFLDACFKRFGRKLGHLDQETLDLAREFNPPVVDTLKERRHIADVLNKIYIESLDNGAIEKTRVSVGAADLGTGSLKRLQALLEKIAPTEDISSMLLPLYVLYDLRVAYSHLTSAEKAQSIISSISTRLEISVDPSLKNIYARLINELAKSLEALTAIVEQRPAV